MNVARDYNSGNNAPENGKRRKFVMLPNEIQDDILLSPAAVLVYAALMRAQKQGEECSPDHQWIAEKAHISVPTVKRALDQLRDRGWVSWTDGGWNRPNIYRLAWSLDSGSDEQLPVAQSELLQQAPVAHSELVGSSHRATALSITDKNTDNNVRALHSVASVGDQDDDDPVLDAAALAALSDVEKVFEMWKLTCGRAKGRKQLTERRREAIQRALLDYPLADVLDAVSGWRNDPWADRVYHNDVTQLLKDGSSVEKFRDLQRDPPPKVRSTGFARATAGGLGSESDYTGSREEMTFK